MNQVMQWMTHDTTRYGYLLEHKEEWHYSLIRFAFMLFMGLIGVLFSGYEYARLPDIEAYPVQTQAPYNQCDVWIAIQKEEEKKHGI